MADIDLTKPVYWKLSEEEQLKGMLLSPEQRMWLQNLYFDYTQDKKNLVPDPNNYADFVQKNSHVTGQLSIIDYLLECSTNAEQEIVNKASQ